MEGRSLNVSQIKSWLDTVQGERQYTAPNFGADYGIFFQAGVPAAILADIEDALQDLSTESGKVEIITTEQGKVTIEISLPVDTTITSILHAPR